MDINQAVKEILKGNVEGKIAESTGTDRSTVDRVIEVGLPMLIGMLGNNTKDEAGAASLDKAVEEDHTGDSLLESLSGLFSGGDKNEDGEKILGHVFGNETQNAAKNVSGKTGIDMETVLGILSFLAPIVMAYLGKQKKEKQLDSGGLSDLLKGQKSEDGSPLMDLATTFLDKNKDGNIIDDVLGMFGKRS